MVSGSYEKLKSSRERGEPMVTMYAGPLVRLGQEAWDIAEENGWHADQDTFTTYIAGVAEEIGEAIQAYRDQGTLRKVVTTVIGYDTVTGEPILQRPGKPEGVGPELADILIRVAHLAHFLSIDLDKEVSEKMDYNRTRKYKDEYDN